MYHLVRELYKQALRVGLDYPHPKGIEYVRQQWKSALRNPKNCPSCYPHVMSDKIAIVNNKFTTIQEREIRKAVAKGHAMIREMIGIIQLKKYRTMNQRYN